MKLKCALKFFFFNLFQIWYATIFLKKKPNLLFMGKQINRMRLAKGVENHFVSQRNTNQ